MKLVGHSNKQRRQNNEKSAECHTVRVRATLPRVKQNGTDYLAQKKKGPRAPSTLHFAFETNSGKR